MVTVTQTNDFISSYKQGSLTVPGHRINEILGFTPQTELCEKVTVQWDFKLDGEPCSIWDYYGVEFSFFGPADKFAHLFGAENVKGGA